MTKLHRIPKPGDAGIDLLSADVDALSDELLMHAHMDGNPVAFTLLTRRYERELFSYLRRMVVDPAFAEDIFQNTFLQIHLKQHLYERGRPFRPWLYTIATNQAIDAIRRNKKHQRTSLDSEHSGGKEGGGASLMNLLPADFGDPIHAAERSEKAALVRQAVDELPEHLRHVVVLSYYQGLKYKEIADVLGIPVGTVKSRLHAAIKKLVERWRAWELMDDGR